MSRRWHHGWSQEVDGVLFRVQRGVKSADDLRLEWFVKGRWTPVKMRVAALMTDFFYENEDVLYPPPRFKGGKKFLTYLGHSAKYGWDKADTALRLERFQKERQPPLFDDEGVA